MGNRDGEEGADSKDGEAGTLRAWTKEDVRMLKTLAREKTKTSAIAGNSDGASFRRDTKHRFLV
jgi:hypothetical protein